MVRISLVAGLIFVSILKDFGFYERFHFNNIFPVYVWILHVSYFIKISQPKFFFWSDFVGGCEQRMVLSLWEHLVLTRNSCGTLQLLSWAPNDVVMMMAAKDSGLKKPHLTAGWHFRTTRDVLWWFQDAHYYARVESSLIIVSWYSLKSYFSILKVTLEINKKLNWRYLN